MLVLVLQFPRSIFCRCVCVYVCPSPSGSVTVCLSIYLSCLSIRLSDCIKVSVTVHVSLTLSACLSCLSISLSDYMKVSVSVFFLVSAYIRCLSMWLCDYASVSLCACLVSVPVCLWLSDRLYSLRLLSSLYPFVSKRGGEHPPPCSLWNRWPY